MNIYVNKMNKIKNVFNISKHIIENVFELDLINFQSIGVATKVNRFEFLDGYRGIFFSYFK